MPASDLLSASDVILEAFSIAIKPDRTDYTVDEWADEFRVLSSKASAEPGRYRTQRTPYLKEIMRKLSPDDPCEKVVFMKASQVGGTEVGLNWIGSIIDVFPGPLLMIQPTVELAKRVSKQRVAPMIAETPSLREKVADVKSRTSSNTLFEKDFPGGFMMLGGANSPVGLRSAPVRFLMADEVDAYPLDVGGEGDPITLAEDRTKTFKRNRKIFMVSTPVNKGQSIIENAFENSDKRYFNVPCPFCNHKQKLVFSNLRWEQGNYKKIYYSCESCGEAIPEKHKTWMLENGEWIPERPEVEDVCGYHINALYSPIGWFSWSDIAKRWDKSQGNIDKLKAFINGMLGETWEEKGEAPEWDKLYRRRESYPINVVPLGGLVLTAGVDIQRDRLECQLVAWGRKMQSWSVAYHVVKGDPNQLQVWKDLKKILDANYLHANGVPMSIRQIAIDSGDQTQIVYQRIREWGDHRVMAVKGMHDDKTAAVMVGQPKSVDIRPVDGKRIYNAAKLWPVYVSVLKKELYAHLRQEEPINKEDYPYGYVHFPLYEEEYFKQITAEQLIDKVIHGRKVFRWVKVYERNEALDTFIYARAAAFVAGVDRYSDENWSDVENQLRLHPVDLNDKNQRYTEERRKRSSDFWSGGDSYW